VPRTRCFTSTFRLPVRNLNTSPFQTDFCRLYNFLPEQKPEIRVIYVLHTVFFFLRDEIPFGDLGPNRLQRKSVLCVLNSMVIQYYLMESAPLSKPCVRWSSCKLTAVFHGDVSAVSSALKAAGDDSDNSGAESEAVKCVVQQHNCKFMALQIYSLVCYGNTLLQ
jgi:hypothetical protein